jgi:hypothetical protein
MDEDYRQLIAEKKGVRASSFDILAGLNPITASPPGLMHAAFLRKGFVSGGDIIPLTHPHRHDECCSSRYLAQGRDVQH